MALWRPVSRAFCDLFESLLAEDGLYSAQLAAYQHGTKVVDLSGGP